MFGVRAILGVMGMTALVAAAAYAGGSDEMIDWAFRSAVPTAIAEIGAATKRALAAAVQFNGPHFPLIALIASLVAGAGLLIATVRGRSMPSQYGSGSRRSQASSVQRRDEGHDLTSSARSTNWDCEPQPLRSAIRGPARFGLAIIVLFVGGFGLWASIAPLAGGALAPGFISPETSRKTVQHLEGGIISEIAVKDGDDVTIGQPLIVLAKVQPQSNHEMLQNRRERLLALIARLDAEQAGAETVDFPEELRRKNGALFGAAQSQLQLFQTRKEAYDAKRRVLEKRLQQLSEQIKGYEAQSTSATKQLDLITEEVEGKLSLLKRGLIPKPEALRILRMRAEIEGRIGELAAEIARTEQQIGETQIQLVNLAAERSDAVAKEADAARLELTEIEQKLRASQDVLERTVVRSPVDGNVVNIRFKTVGGIVRPGEAILDVVPKNDSLLIEARVSPIDIDVVQPGMTARIHFTAYSGRSHNNMKGVVQTVSADRIIDKDTKQGFYLARVLVDKKALSQSAPDVHLVPGMPAEVLIVAEHQTMLEYLVRPFRDAMRRSFRQT